MLKLTKKDANNTFKCTVKLLDDNDVLDCDFQSYYKGRHLLDFVYRHLNLVECDYFGLRYIDQNKQRHWLDPNRNILRQIKSLNPVLFCFRVKFYPSDPLKLKEEITRYYLFLQLRRDLLHGRLYCIHTDAALLGAYIIQADLGDTEDPEAETNYVSEYKLFLKQTPKLEEKIMEAHLTLKGLSASDSETSFLKKASSLDTYGVDPYSVKDHRGIHIYLGLSHSGILTFEGSKKTHHYQWNEIQKLNYEGKMFIVHWFQMEKKNTVGFKCSSSTACRNLWRSAVEQRLFYTMDSSSKTGTVVTGGSFFSRGSRFRFQGRCAKEVLEESSGIFREQPPVKRICLRNIGRSTSLPATPADSANYDINSVGRIHRPLPYIDRSTSLDEVLYSADSPTPGYGLYDQDPYQGVPYCPESTLPPLGPLEPLSEDAENNDENIYAPDEKYKENQHLYSPEFCSSSPSGYSRSTVDGDGSLLEVDASKDFYYSKGGEFQGTRQYCDCDRPRFDGETTSSESLGPPTEPIEDIQTNKRVVFPHRNKQPHNQNHSPLKPTELATQPRSWLRFIKPHFSPRSYIVSNAVKFSQVFLATFTLVVVLLVLFTVVLFETETASLEGFRTTREMVLLKVQYYDPLKTYLTELISGQ